VVKHESKGRINKRLYIEIVPGAAVAFAQS